MHTHLNYYPFCYNYKFYLLSSPIHAVSSPNAKKTTFEQFDKKKINCVRVCVPVVTVDNRTHFEGETERKKNNF